MISKAIYTEKNDCQDCYKCIRYCPVKAIKVEGRSASIIHNHCLYCGKCVQVCPVNAKKVRNDLNSVKFYLSSKTPVVLSIAPSYKSEFPDYSEFQLLQALYGLGFCAVSETALGAELVSESVKKWLDQQASGTYYSSCCPVVVRLIQKYYPEQISRLCPHDSPMQAHAKYLRKTFGENTIVVFAGPCIAKKQECEDYPGGADIAITFSELRNWLAENKFFPDAIPEKPDCFFSPQISNKGCLYPVEGGMLSTLKRSVTPEDKSFMSFSGLQSVTEILDQIEEKKDTKLFIEFLACEGGCVNGPATSGLMSRVGKRLCTLQHAAVQMKNKHEKKEPEFSLYTDFNRIFPATFCTHEENEILDALKIVGKTSDKDEMNCGGCGYDSCRSFAIAMLDGKAERNMCVSYMRKVAQNKATVLIQKMPYGVVLVDDKLKVIESNEKFAQMLGEDAADIYSVKPGMEGASLEKLTNWYKLFANILEKGLDEFHKDIHISSTMYHLSIFTIQKYKIVCGVLHLVDQQNLSKQFLKERLQKVISENLATAQKTAFLLGETASHTEIMLNNIIDSYQVTSDEV